MGASERGPEGLELVRGSKVCQSTGTCPLAGYLSFANAARFTSSVVPPEYKPYVILGLSWPTISAARFSLMPAFSSWVTTVLRTE